MMNKEEKLRRRDISRQYIRDTEDDCSLKQHPSCDSSGFLCDMCARQDMGSGLHPFIVKLADMPGATDAIACDGYIARKVVDLERLERAEERVRQLQRAVESGQCDPAAAEQDIVMLALAATVATSQRCEDE